MPFEKFTQIGRSFRPKISIRRTGSLGFNAAAVTKFALDKRNYALLFFDRDSQKIGIKPIEKEEEGAHKIHRAKQSTWISAKRFLDYYGVKIENMRCDAVWSNEDNMIVIELSGGIKGKNRTLKSSV